MSSAFIVGGTGQIGFAIAQRLTDEGWDVRIASRSAQPRPTPWRHVRLDRNEPGALTASLGEGADLLVDCLAFAEADAKGLLAAQESAGRIVAISSASVYRDAAGRTLDEARDCGFPHFPVPIPEDHPTVPPGPVTYSTRKIAMERRLLNGARVPVTILRPCAIHGPHSKHAREWWFVKRLLDGRRHIPLAYGGRSQFQTTSTDAIAEAVLHAVRGQVPSILNVTDADAPTVAEIGGAIMATMGRETELVGLPDEPYPPNVGATPWSVERPLVCRSSLPPSRTYAETAPAALRWLEEATLDHDWHEILPQLAAYPRNHFDYETEDRVLSGRSSP